MPLPMLLQRGIYGVIKKRNVGQLFLLEKLIYDRKSEKKHLYSDM